jgi:hypothetical protein
LSKANKLLELVDSKQQWVVATVIPKQPEQIIVFQQQIPGKIEDISIHSFRDSAPRPSESVALVEVHNNNIIVAAPVELFNLVITEVETLANITSSKTQNLDLPTQKQIQVEDSSAQVETDPNINDLKRSSTDKLHDEEFYNELLRSLAEAEKIESQLRAEELSKTEVKEVPEQIPVERLVPEKIGELQKKPQPAKSTIVDLEQEQAEPSFEPGDYEVELNELANEELVLDLPELLNVVELIDLLGKHMNLDLLYDKN